MFVKNLIIFLHKHYWMTFYFPVYKWKYYSKNFTDLAAIVIILLLFLFVYKDLFATASAPSIRVI